METHGDPALTNGWREKNGPKCMSLWLVVMYVKTLVATFAIKYKIYQILLYLFANRPLYSKTLHTVGLYVAQMFMKIMLKLL